MYFMLNLNDSTIKSEGSTFDGSKIFGYEAVENNRIVRFVDNVVIAGFNTGESANGNKFWDIQLKDSKGNETNLREYNIDKARDDWEKKQTNQLKRLKHMLSKFVPEGTALPQAATFPELWAGVQALLVANKCNTKPFRLKVIYNNAGYIDVPQYVPYMESMTVNVLQSTLKLNEKFDTLIRPSANKPEEVSATATDAEVPFSF